MIQSPEQPSSIAPPIDQDASDTDRQHLLTVNVEDYFQVGAFRRYIRSEHWYRFETRLQQNVEQILELLDQHQTKATFFVLGWTAEHDPVLVRQIAEAGHEVASRGFLHQPLLNCSREQIRDDLLKSRSVLQDVTGQPIYGYRLSDGWLTRDSLWLLDELAAAGYRYDSSLLPRQRDFADDANWRRIRTIETNHGPVFEIPLSTMETPGGWIPIAGGNYQRQVPDFLMKRMVDKAITGGTDPFVMYFQAWELDDKQPELSVADRLTRIRHYRKLGKYRRILPQYLQRYRFTSVENHATKSSSPLAALLTSVGPNRERGIQPSSTTIESNAPALAIQADAREFSSADHPATDRQAVTLVIPCFNEEKSITYLANTLASVTDRLSDRWMPQIVFVDDCSTDNTFDVLQRQFGEQDHVRVVRHEHNRGVSAAILTGIAASETEIVASMDCDCSYDPHELAAMLPLLTDDVSMVTASPYHKAGQVRNVPGWRLFLSRGLSAIYQRLLKQPLATWTSCFRIYRRSDVLDLNLQEDGFLGTAELAAELILRNRSIVEHPATLEVRLFGLSKMKTVKAILSHLRLLLSITLRRGQYQPHNHPENP